MSSSLFRNVRFYVLLFSVAWSVALFLFVRLTIPQESLRIYTITQYYALTALAYLYFTLLCGPFVFAFKTFPYKGIYFKSRRALGVSVCYFALLHVYFAFFKQLGSFAGLPLLSSRYLFAVTLGTTSLLILCTMALTSFDAVVKKMKFHNWKLLHRLVYAVGIFTLLHLYIWGTHFRDLSKPLPRLLGIGIAFLLYLYAYRIDALIKRRFVAHPQWAIARYVAAGLIVAGVLYMAVGA